MINRSENRTYINSCYWNSNFNALNTQPSYFPCFSAANLDSYIKWLPLNFIILSYHFCYLNFYLKTFVVHNLRLSDTESNCHYWNSGSHLVFSWAIQKIHLISNNGCIKSSLCHFAIVHICLSRLWLAIHLLVLTGEFINIYWQFVDCRWNYKDPLKTVKQSSINDL